MIAIAIIEQQAGSEEEYPGDKYKQQYSDACSSEAAATCPPATENQECRRETQAEDHDIGKDRILHHEVVDGYPHRGQYGKGEGQEAYTDGDIFRPRCVEVTGVGAIGKDILRIDALHHFTQFLTQTDVGVRPVVYGFLQNG